MNEPPESNPAREAEAGSLQRSDFLAAMTHELRTPLNALIGMSRLLLGTALNREQEEYAQTMLLAADAMLGVTNNILDFSKIQAGRVTLEEIDFDLVDVIEDAIDLVAVKVWEKGLRLTYDIDARVPRGLRGDPARLRQVLSNLLSNAVKFTDAGSVHVSVEAGDPRDGGSELRFAVKDTGIGIKPEGLERLFKAFSQADPTITRRFGGTGLGLAICERLVALMSGRISAESQYGRGSVFRFTVVVGRGSPVAAEVPALAGRRVLIVDGDPAHLALQAWRCRAFGMQVATAPSPHAVLECLAGERVDIALVDDEVDGVRGAELARAIGDCAGELPIILMATGSPAGAEPAGEPFAARVLKPTRSRSLARALEGALRGDDGSAPAAASGAAAMGTSGLQRWRVLVADDNVTNRKLMATMLGKLGIAPDVAEDGIEAVDALRRKRYDLVFMDMQMPEMDGLEATREIVKRFGTARPRIVAVTANASPSDRERCLQAGMDDYVSKPILPEELRRVVEASRVWAREQQPAHGRREDAYLDMEIVQMLEEVFRAEPAKLAELLKEFLAESSSRLDVIAVAAESGDFAKVISVAHKLKGAAAGVGAKELARVAYRVKCAGYDGNGAALDGLLPELNRALAATRESLAAMDFETDGA